MPNHVCNTVKFIGKAEYVNSILANIRSFGENIFDFNNIIPRPDSVLKETEELNKEHGFDGVSHNGIMLMSDKEYNWNNKNWGTKWNAYDASYKAYAEPTLVFFTAWSDPQPIFMQLSNFYPDVIINTYAEDEGGCFVQNIVYKGGKIILSSIIDGRYNYLSDTISVETGYSEEEVEEYYKKVDPVIATEVTRICSEAGSNYTLRNPIIAI